MSEICGPTIERIEESEKRRHTLRQQVMRTRQKQQEAKAQNARAAAAREEMGFVAPNCHCYTQCGQLFIMRDKQELDEELKQKMERARNSMPKLEDMEKALLEKLKAHEEAHRKLEQDFIAQMQSVASRK